MAYLNENVARKLPTGNGTFQAGVSDVDTGKNYEKGFPLPCIIDPQLTWIDYVCSLNCYLDSGIIVHKPLPQSVQSADMLGVGVLNSPSFAAISGGVNLASAAKFTDVVQRMATSKYRFCLTGWARRIRFQIPIPAMKSVGGVPAIPDDEEPQEAGNVIIGNLSGVPVWFARWKLWYTVAQPPTTAQDPPQNLADHIGAQTTPSPAIPLPTSYPDPDAKRTAPQQALPPLLNPIQRPPRYPGLGVP